MMKPIIVCGVDFSGTSMTAGLLRAAGIDMGDVDTAREVAASKSPVRYQTFEDKDLRRRLEPLAMRFHDFYPDDLPLWIDLIGDYFKQYAQDRDADADGWRWGVKCNGLLFLAMDPGFELDEFEWVTTYRPFEESLESCRQKLGHHPRLEPMMAAESIAYEMLVQRINPIMVNFHDLLNVPVKSTHRLLSELGIHDDPTIVADLINPTTKGVPMPPSHVQLDFRLNTEDLKRALHEHEELFGEYPFRGLPGSPHEQMTDIWVRFNDMEPFLQRGSLDGLTDEHDSVWYDSANDLPVKDLAFTLMHEVRGERLGGILITKLPPGGQILPHRDSGWHAEYYQKYYVAVQNGVGATFEFEDGTIAPQEGDVYWFNNSYLHWVHNESDQDRIAMIVCIRTDHLPQEVRSCHG